MTKNYYNEFIDFFKKHNLYDQEMFDYLNEDKIIIDYRELERRSEIRCYHQIINNTLNKVWVCVPVICDYKTLLINIYIYMHAIQLYKQLGKKIKPQTTNQSIAMLYEKLYLEENPNTELKEYISVLDNYTKEKGTIEEKTSLEIQQDLLEYYNKKKPNFNKIQKKAKKISKKYERKNI